MCVDVILLGGFSHFALAKQTDFRDNKSFIFILIFLFQLSDSPVDVIHKTIPRVAVLSSETLSVS